MAVATKPSKQEHRLLGDILVEQGIISPLQLDEGLQRQRLTGDMLGRVLVSMGMCEEQDIIEALGLQAGMEKIDLTKIKIPQEVIQLLTPDVARFYNVMPVRIVDDTLLVAMADPLNIQILDDIAQIAGMKVWGAISNQEDVVKAWETNYSMEGDSITDMLDDLRNLVGDYEMTMEEMGMTEVIGDTENLVELAQQPEVIKIVNLCFLEAVVKRASDIHFEVYEDTFRIRLRIDGVLMEIVSPPKDMALALTSRIKVICSMDIGERRLPQDARIELKVGESLIDIRVSTLPTIYGESVVMRILDRTAIKIDLHSLGMPDNILKTMDTIIHKPNGILLVTGPTGSGKTTTLYACLNILNQPEVKIITTEDPVELQIDRLVQVQIHEDIGLTFSSCLRAILRQDPDIIMVGEIRDLDTAEIAVEASLTGHLVLSTLHTNSAPETITRLLDMDVEPFLITASLEGVLAQRLIRVLCKSCREHYQPDEEEMTKLGLPKKWQQDQNLRMYRPKGCAACDFRGYRGRTGLYEMLVIDEGIDDLILERAMAFDIRHYARKEQQMRTLREEGIIKCIQGITSAEEILLHTDSFEDK